MSPNRYRSRVVLRSDRGERIAKGTIFRLARRTGLTWRLEAEDKSRVFVTVFRGAVNSQWFTPLPLVRRRVAP